MDVVTKNKTRTYFEIKIENIRMESKNEKEMIDKILEFKQEVVAETKLAQKVFSEALYNVLGDEVALPLLVEYAMFDKI